jgi:capsular exopolysaccharide synthesis family protein
MNQKNGTNNFQENDIFLHGSLNQIEKPDFKKWFVLFFSNWYWLLLFLMFGLLIAFFVNKYWTPVYKFESSVLIKSDDQGNMPENMAMLSGFSSSNLENFQNQALLLKTESQILKTLDQLDFNVCYYQKRRIGDKDSNVQNIKEFFDASVTSTSKYQEREFYKENSLRVNINPNHNQVLDVRFYLYLDSNKQLNISASSENVITHSFADKMDVGNLISFSVDTDVVLGKVTEGEHFSFLIEADEEELNEILKENDLYFVVRDNKRLVEDFENINVSLASKGASIAKMTLTGTCFNKTKVFLDKSMDVWIQNGLDQKNQIANKTIAFIDQQLFGLGDTLGRMGTKLQRFRTSNKVVTPTVQVEAAYIKLQELQSEIAKLKTQAAYYERLNSYLNKREDYSKLISPASVGIEQSVLDDYIAQLGEVRAALYQYKGKENLNNPYLEQQQRKEGTLLAGLYEKINSQQEYIAHRLNELWVQEVELKKEQNLLPRKEQQMMNIKRSYDLTNDLYTLLLGKRVEAQIQKASNLPDNEIVEPANFVEVMQPKTLLIFVVGALLGLLLPMAFMFFKTIFTNTIQSKDELSSICSAPLIGSLMQTKKKGDVITQKFPQDPVSEAFRAIRTRIDYLTKGSAKKTILITSSMSGEGKTFCAINIAGIYALSGKKTIVLGFDLRQPKFDEFLDLPENIGLTSYLIGRNSVKEIIQNTKYKNLDCITSGPIPPNPAELIDSDKTKYLFEELEKIYDCIVIDTSPVGLVTDSLLLKQYANVNLFIVRQQLTNKGFFVQSMKLLQETQFENVGLVMNGIKVKKYGNDYGYGYGAGYVSSVKHSDLSETPTV